MQKLPKACLYTLQPQQTIAQVIPSDQTGNILVEAATGTGKTWFVFQHLMQNHHVVLLCPTVAQVKQCEDSYAHAHNCHFIHGEKNISSTQYKTLAQQNLVMTFDQYPKLRKYLKPDTILVVDEAQKLYSVGHYREKAIQPIISDLVQQHYVKSFLLTATFTDYIFEQLNIHISQHFKFLTATPIQRHIEVINYTYPDPLQWYQDVLTRLRRNKQNGEEKLIIVRLNDITFCKQIRLMFEQEGFDVMLVNRHEMQSIDCREMLKHEKLNKKYQVVLCSSVLDEAINLNNPNDEVDSIHFVGKYAHPEEITQFIGRMRKANPPVYIHLPLTASQGNAKTCDKMCKRLKNKMLQELGKTIHFLEYMLKPMLSPNHLEAMGDFVSSKINIAKSLNALTYEAFDCNGFWTTNDDSITLNYASFTARLYQIDTLNTYTDIAYLSYRLKHYIPDLKVSTKTCHLKVSSQLAAQLNQSKEDLQQSKVNAIGQVKADIITEMNDAASFPIQKHLELYHSDQSTPYDATMMEAEHQVFKDMIGLRKVLTNLEDMGDAIKHERVSKVLNINHHYQYHPIVKPMMNELAKAFQQPDFLSVRHTYVEITKIMNDWLAKVTKSQLITKLLREYPLSYLESSQRSVKFNEGGAIRFLRKYSYIKVFNDKKPIEQKKIQFIGLAAYNYQYYVLPESQGVIRYTMVQGVKYNAVTGQKLDKHSKNGGFIDVELD